MTAMQMNRTNKAQRALTVALNDDVVVDARTGEDGGAERTEREGRGTGSFERREGRDGRQGTQRQDQVAARAVRRTFDERRQACQTRRQQRRLSETSQTGSAPPRP